MSITLYNEKRECCGCWACVNICPTDSVVMKRDEEGFCFPSITKETCVECGLCRKVCPLKSSENAVIEES